MNLVGEIEGGTEDFRTKACPLEVDGLDAHEHGKAGLLRALEQGPLHGMREATGENDLVDAAGLQAPSQGLCGDIGQRLQPFSVHGRELRHRPVTARPEGEGDELSADTGDPRTLRQLGQQEEDGRDDEVDPDERAVEGSLGRGEDEAERERAPALRPEQRTHDLEQWPGQRPHPVEAHPLRTPGPGREEHQQQVGVVAGGDRRLERGDDLHQPAADQVGQAEGGHDHEDVLQEDLALQGLVVQGRVPA